MESRKRDRGKAGPETEVKNGAESRERGAESFDKRVFALSSPLRKDRNEKRYV
jgi:hypothetical protein